jgi:hypothetical protein
METDQDFYTAHAWAKGHGYAASINADASGLMTIQFTAPGGTTSQTARLGDLLILKNDVELTVVLAANISSTPGEGVWTIAPLS